MTDRLFNTKILIYAKKYKAIQLLGGKCENCNENRFFRLSFHHIDNKKENTINFLKTYSWDKIEKEILICKLLCRNCHQELHSSNKDSIYKKSKILYLEFKNINSCKECGYDKCNESLTFHHNKNKIMKLSGCRSSSIDKIKENIIDELNKCDVFCINCHTELHSDLEFLEKNINLIIEKSKNLKKISNKINREQVKKMYIDNIKQTDISKHFNCSKSTISDIIKELNINKEYKIDEFEVKKLYNSGMKTIDISKKLNLNKNSTYSIVRKFKTK